MVNCIAMAHFSFCRGLALDDYVSARPSYFKTIYNAYIDIAILGMLYVLLYTLLHHAIYTTLRTIYNNAIHPIRTEQNSRKK